MKYSRLWEIEGFRAVVPYERVLKVLMSPDIHGTKNVSVGVVFLPPGNRSGLHVHENEEEILYILSGRGRIVVGDDEISGEIDTVVYVPPQTSHQLINTGDETFKVLWVFSPPGPEKPFIGKKLGKA